MITIDRAYIDSLRLWDTCGEMFPTEKFLDNDLSTPGALLKALLSLDCCHGQSFISRLLLKKGVANWDKTPVETYLRQWAMGCLERAESYLDCDPRDLWRVEHNLGIVRSLATRKWGDDDDARIYAANAASYALGCATLAAGHAPLGTYRKNQATEHTASLRHGLELFFEQLLDSGAGIDNT